MKLMRRGCIIVLLVVFLSGMASAGFYEEKSSNSYGGVKESFASVSGAGDSGVVRVEFNPENIRAYKLRGAENDGGSWARVTALKCEFSASVSYYPEAMVPVGSWGCRWGAEQGEFYLIMPYSFSYFLDNPMKKEWMFLKDEKNKTYVGFSILRMNKKTENSVYSDFSGFMIGESGDKLEIIGKIYGSVLPGHLEYDSVEGEIIAYNVLNQQEIVDSIAEIGGNSGSCEVNCTYDDSELRERLDSIEERVDEFEDWKTRIQGTVDNIVMSLSLYLCENGIENGLCLESPVPATEDCTLLPQTRACVGFYSKTYEYRCESGQGDDSSCNEGYCTRKQEIESKYCMRGCNTQTGLCY